MKRRLSAMHAIPSTDVIGISDDCSEEKVTKRFATETMDSTSSSSSPSLCSLPSRYGMKLIVACCCLWSLTVASGFNLGFHSFPKLGRQGSSHSETESPSSTALVMEAVPEKRKFNRQRNKFSRTSRGYRNEGEFGTIDEIETSEPTSIIEEEERDSIEVVINNKDGVKSKRMTIGRRIQAFREAGPPTPLRIQIKKEKKPVKVETVEELRHAVLDQQLSLSETTIVERETVAEKPNTESSPLMDHAVRNLIKERYFSRSTPGNRLASDNSTLAIAIEGGGMRGCVSAGMVAAITALGLSDTIDTIYGSSAGSVVGAYMVSRQVCLDVYVDILPASKEFFVCKKRMITNLASLGLGRILKNEGLSSTPPGMNISFVLDGILGDDHGLRPLDIDAFKENGQHQKLRVVSSCVDPQTGKLYSRCFGNDDFFHEDFAMVRADQKRKGIFACLQASMTVPGATGPPVELVRKSSIKNNATTLIENPLPCFDAFCFEPIPYRSAVEEGATHVVVLASRPEDFVPPTKPSIYETGIAPLYFNSHGQQKVSKFFAEGGQQYLYAEDLLLLEQAKQPTEDGVLVPPPEILYGVDRTNDINSNIRNREENWNRAHLYPLRVPKGYKELSTLEQDKDKVLEAVRDGFMTAFDALKDIVGLESYKGEDVAKLVFPSSDDDETPSPQESPSSQKTMVKPEKVILNTRMRVPGEPIPRYEISAPIEENSSNEEPPKRRRRRIFKRIRARGGGLFGRGSHRDRDTEEEVEETVEEDKLEEICFDFDEEEFSAAALLDCLPGFQDGKYSHLAKGLREQYLKEQQEQI